MKLPIKKKFFDLIKNGKKELEWRDAHITFFCEETGEVLRKEIIDCLIVPKGRYENWLEGTFESEEEFKRLFSDNNLICFRLK